MSPNRISQRFITQENAQLELYGKAGSFNAVVKNLSHTGCCLELLEEIDTQFILGELMQITINLNSIGKKHTLNGELVWNKDYGLGIRFLKKNEIIDKLIQKSV